MGVVRRVVDIRGADGNGEVRVAERVAVRSRSVEALPRQPRRHGKLAPPAKTTLDDSAQVGRGEMLEGRD